MKIKHKSSEIMVVFYVMLICPKIPRVLFEDG